jgi:hypothetical protein
MRNKAKTKKIQTVLSLCLKNKQNIHFEMDVTSTILCTHKTNVVEYNTIMLHKQFSIT